MSQEFYSWEILLQRKWRQDIKDIHAFSLLNNIPVCMCVCVYFNKNNLKKYLKILLFACTWHCLRVAFPVLEWAQINAEVLGSCCQLPHVNRTGSIDMSTAALYKSHSTSFHHFLELSHTPRKLLVHGISTSQECILNWIGP